MRQFLFLSLIFVFQGCKHPKQEYNQISQDQERNISEVIHPGKKLMETNCYVCHNPSTDQKNRIAPPMAAIKMHYKTEGISKEEFISHFQEWIVNPTEEKAKMYGAVKKFGVMPKTPFPEEIIYQIAEYIFDNNIEKPEWFDMHYQKGQGMGFGREKGNGMRRMLDKQKIKQIESENLSYGDVGMNYALKTKQALGSHLIGAIQEKGIVEAIKFCNEQAYPITDSMSIKFNATIKRVSDKPRNSKNKANTIELEYIKAFKEIVKLGKEPNPIVVEQGENIKFYYPIVTNAMCLQCHGEVDKQIEAETRKTLKALYPYDKAIGYDINNVRGIWSITYNKHDE